MSASIDLFNHIHDHYRNSLFDTKEEELLHLEEIHLENLLGMNKTNPEKRKKIEHELFILQEKRKSILEYKRKLYEERAKKIGRIKRQIMEEERIYNQTHEKIFFEKYQHVTIGGKPLSLDSFFSLYAFYDVDNFFIEKGNDFYPKKYVSAMEFYVKTSGSRYRVKALFKLKDKILDVSFADLGTKTAADFVRDKLIQFYTFHGFNVQNHSKLAIVDEE